MKKTLEIINITNTIKNNQIQLFIKLNKIILIKFIITFCL